MRDFYYERKLLCPRRYENLHIFKIISGLVVLSLFLARQKRNFPSRTGSPRRVTVCIFILIVCRVGLVKNNEQAINPNLVLETLRNPNWFRGAGWFPRG
jgi:hypothetical protein